MQNSQIPIIGDVLEAAGRIFGKSRSNSGPEYAGKYGSPAFFHDAQAGDAGALRLLKKKGYSHIWDVAPGSRGTIQREIERNYTRSFVGRMVPRGIATGSPMFGLNRAYANIHLPALKMGLGIGGALTMFSVATAPRGKMASTGVGAVGATVGGIAGAAVGAAFLGMPGELLGGYVGGTIGEKAGAVVEGLKDLGHQARHSNFGGGYQDSEIAYTMRQRAVQEMGSSSLNARQYVDPSVFVVPGGEWPGRK